MILVPSSQQVYAEPDNTTISDITVSAFTMTFVVIDPDGIASIELSGSIVFPNCGTDRIRLGIPLADLPLTMRVTDCQAEPDVTVWQITEGVVILLPPPEEELGDLVTEIEGLELSKPIEKSLTQKLNDAIKLLTDKNDKNDLNSCNKLDDFVNQVNAQEGKALTTTQADSLRDSVQEIKTLIGCP
jgi:hypothetical protein